MMEYFISAKTVQLLGWTLMHFMWQGLLVALLLVGARYLLRHSSAKTRYAVSCTALLLMILLPVITGILVYRNLTSGTISLVGDQSFSFLLGPATTGLPVVTTMSAYFASVLPWLVVIWFAGVLFFAARFAGGWSYAQMIVRRERRSVDAAWARRFEIMVEKLHISRPVRFFVSTRIDVPMVIGWLRPAVLIPASIFTGLTPEQIDMIIAHELAHIRRYDYAVNVLLSACETFLFYHPAVWWVSRQVRIEREHCCDDLVVSLYGDTVSYARALTNLETIRHTSATPRLALGATDGSLLNRIRRLLDQPVQAIKRGDRWVMGICLIALVGILHLSFSLIGKARQKEEIIIDHIAVEGLVDPDIHISITEPDLSELEFDFDFDFDFDFESEFDFETDLEAMELALQELETTLEYELEPNLEAYEEALRELEFNVQSNVEAALEAQQEGLAHMELSLEATSDIEELEEVLEGVTVMLEDLELTFSTDIETHLDGLEETDDYQEAEVLYQQLLEKYRNAREHMERGENVEAYQQAMQQYMNELASLLQTQKEAFKFSVRSQQHVSSEILERLRDQIQMHLSIHIEEQDNPIRVRVVPKREE